MAGFTAREKLKEVEREIGMRRRVYPGQIARGNLSDATAERQIAILQAIADDYRMEVDQLQLPI